MNNLNIGDKIRELRIRKGMTQQELADIMGITYTSVSYWESGKSKPDIFQIKKLSEYFHVTTDYIYGLTDENIKEDVQMRTLFRKASDLSDEKKEKLNSILKASINALWDDSEDDK